MKISKHAAERLLQRFKLWFPYLIEHPTIHGARTLLEILIKECEEIHDWKYNPFYCNYHGMNPKTCKVLRYKELMYLFVRDDTVTTVVKKYK